MGQTRRRFSSEEKITILKRHLVNGERISDICDELDLNPNLFYKWQRILFEHGARAFEPKQPNKADRKDRELSQMKHKIGEKDAVISELVTELIKAKKNIGEL